MEHAQNDMASGFFNWSCFSAQQGAEKAVKAALMKMGAEPWGHSVASLLHELPATASLPPDLVDMAQELDKAYIPSRSPDAHPAGAPSELYNRIEAERLIGYGRRILGFCQGLLAQT